LSDCYFFLYNAQQEEPAVPGRLFGIVVFIVGSQSGGGKMNRFRRWVLALGMALVVLAGPAVVYALSGGHVEIQAAASFLGEADDDLAGWSVAGAGDVNGDGYGDLLIGAQGNDDSGSAAGAAYLVLGGPDGWGLGKGLGQSQIRQYSGEVANDQSGYSVAGAGDVNGDGYDDFLIGAINNDDAGFNAGAAYLVLGSATPTSASLSTAIEYMAEAASDRAGWSVAGAGDVNGDGYDDFLIGSPANGTSGNAGAAYLVLGSATPTGGSLATAIKYGGEATSGNAGISVAGAGDVNGDGYRDLLIGASLAGAGDDGIAYLVLGSAAPSSASLATAIKYNGEAAADFAGIDVAGAGDVNGDGYDDMLVGAYGNFDGGAFAGAAYLVLGSASPASANLSNAIQYRGEAANDEVGYGLAGVGDVNGDGYDDMLIGAYGNDDGTTDAGAAYLVLGRDRPVSSSLSTAIEYTGKGFTNRAGRDVAAAGDVNGDGYNDLLIGAYLNGDSASTAGAAYLIFSDGLSSHSPSYRERQRLNGSGNTVPVLFEQTGVLVDFTAGSLAGSDITVSRYAFHPCSTDKRLQMPIWTVESPKMTAGATVDLRFDYTDGAIDGMNEANLTVWTRPAGRPCGAWTQVASSTVDAVHNRITATGLTSLSQFTVSEGTPSPTAVREATMGLVLAQEPLWLVGLLALLVVTAGATYWYLRQQGMALVAVPAEQSKVMEELRQIKALLDPTDDHSTS
jgi:hypothetical protein